MATGTARWSRCATELLLPPRGALTLLPQVAGGMKFKPPISDINAPDLYIPLMGFLTYCVLCCLADVLSVPTKFKPEVRPETRGHASPSPES